MVDLCLTLAADNAAGLQKKIEDFSGKVPIIEVRLDFMEKVVFPILPADSGTAFLATCRPEREGGRYTGPEKDRLEILRVAPEKGFSLVDVEHDVDDYPLFTSPVRVVRSRHDFQGCPPDLKGIYREMHGLPGDLVKLVVTPGETAVLVELLEFMEAALPRSPGIILGMGAAAQVTRILGPFLGNAWTYVSEEDDVVAPGQFSLDLARNAYRLPEWQGIPDLFGIACADGNEYTYELAGSLNAGFRIMGADALAFPLSGVDMEIFLPYAGSSKLPFRGFIELEPGKDKRISGSRKKAESQQKIRRITFENGIRSAETRVYKDPGEIIRDTINYWMG